MTSRLKKAVWLHNLPRLGGPAQVREFVRKYAGEGFDLLIPCVKNPDGLLDYQSCIGVVRPECRSWDPLETLAAEAHKRRIRVHAWYCSAKEGPKGALLKKYPGAVAITRDGKKAGDGDSSFVCVARPEVRRYEAAIMKEAIARYDIAGVHFDYIRVGDNTCYCARCRRVLRRLEGIGPDKIRMWGRMPARWFQWRCDQVTALVREVARFAHRRRKEVSAAVFSGVPDAILNQGQDFVPWSREGLLDLVAPMNYCNSPWLMERYLRNHIAQNAGGLAEHWEGLGRYCMDNRGQFQAQLDAIRRHRVRGVVLFEHHHLKPADFRLLARY